MANNFCRFLSNGYRFKSNGTNLTYQPCCWFGREISVIDNPDFEHQKQEISKISRWTKDCASCHQIEMSKAYGERSPRLRSFIEVPDQSVPDNVPVWLELTIDITCNAACIMCGPWHSTTWRRQEIKHPISKDIVDPAAWLDVIESKVSFEHVRSISFLGGEPFESPIPLKVLEKIKLIRGSLHDVDVHFQTNGSIKPSRALFDLAAECHKIKFNLSMDGVGDRFEYIRYPLKWDRVQKVTQYIKNLNMPNLYWVGLVTIGPLNAYYYNEVEQWFRITIDDDKLLGVKPNKSTGAIDLSHTPVALRQAILEKYGVDHPVSRLLSNLPYRVDKSCVPWLDQLDQRRLNNWRTVFPEMIPFLMESPPRHTS